MRKTGTNSEGDEMREYTNQPEERLQLFDENSVRTTLEAVIEDLLPKCITNEWFLDSVYFANMIDKIISEVEKDII